MERPEKWKILDLDADIQTSDTYIRHKERVVSRNQAIDEYEKYHNHIMQANSTCPIAKLDKEYNQCQARQEIQRLQDKIDNLPSEEELEQIILEYDKGICTNCKQHLDKTMCVVWQAKDKCPVDAISHTDYAKAISKRLRGEV